MQNIFFHPVHISARAQNRERFQIPIHDVWGVACDWLQFVINAYDIEVHAFLLMDNHFHLLASAPLNNMSFAMRYFLSETSRTMNRMSGRINHTWGSQHRPTPIKDYQHFVNAYKYVYYNPVQAKMVDRVEDYPYSTLRGLIGLDRCPITVKDELIFSQDLAKHLAWLNTPPQQSDWDSLKKALRRKVFTLPKVDSRPNPLNYARL